MKYFWLLAFTVFSFNGNAIEKCSTDNLKALLEKSAALIGVNAEESIEVAKLFKDPNYSKSNLTKLKAEFVRVQKQSAAKGAKIAGEITKLAKSHPECDSDKLFTLKQKPAEQ